MNLGDREFEVVGEVRARYRQRLAAGSSAPGLESAGRDAADLSDASNADRLQRADAELHRLLREQPDTPPELLELASSLLKDGGRALSMLAVDDERLEDAPDYVAGLEAIIALDGSRPSFLIRDGRVDVTSSVAGAWRSALDVSCEPLGRAIASVGRIDCGSRHIGTGFLIAPQLILTNQHVLRRVASCASDGTWALDPQARIDFGREHGQPESQNPRRLEEVAFCGPQLRALHWPDHGELDLVMIQLAETEVDTRASRGLPLQAQPGWVAPGARVYVIGYPARPARPGYELSVLERVFDSTFGCKRLAPGLIIDATARLPGFSLAHDATTLGGNSGSLLVTVGDETNAAAIHYGGRASVENWAHVFPGLLSAPSDSLALRDPRTHRTFDECLAELGLWRAPSLQAEAQV